MFLSSGSHGTYHTLNKCCIASENKEETAWTEAWRLAYETKQEIHPEKD